MVKNLETWGRDKARSRYDGGSYLANVTPAKRAVERKKGGPVPGSDSPPLVPSEWPPHPIQPSKKHGGAVWEGSKEDLAEDKRMAKAAGMSMKTWEKSSMDKAHDRGKR